MNTALATKALRVEDIYDAEDEERRLAFITSAIYRRILSEMHLLVTEALDLDPDTFRLSDEATEALLQEAAERVVGISETTRRAIAERLAAGQAAGLTTVEIAESIESLFTVTWPHRAETITRTELGHAQLLSAVDRYRASGLVDRLKIHDGEGHGPCAERNGTTVSIDDPPDLLHPNCVLFVSPVLREGVA
jgi:hypothetical protein